MRDMGLGGFFMHSRTGLATEYLGDEWFELINACADEAERLGMEAWLYDEDRWPSGSAGGLVTRDPQYRMKYLRLRPVPAAEFAWSDGLIAAFACRLNGVDYADCRRIGPNTHAAELEGLTVLAFAPEEMSCDTFYNGYTYLDTLDIEATRRFLEVTHERYAARCGDRLGRSIQGVFTDEPHRGMVMSTFGGNPDPEWIVPWTPKLFESFEKRFGYGLVPRLPELFLRPDGQAVSQVKWHYMEHVQQLFLDHFAKPCDRWCRDHGLVLTGHFLHEDSLTCQAVPCGSVMRTYEHMGAPGVDVLSEGNRNYWIAKQVASAARQLGRKWLLSELYGCTGWQMGFEGHKAVGDWQALFGINLRCHHLSWYTMEGQAKRDYPASILHQSAWWSDYHRVETYFARLGLMMQRGEPCCDVLVVSPIESVWSQIRPGWANGLSAAAPEIQALEAAYRDLFHWLAGAQVDFDYGDEDHLHRFGRIDADGTRLIVGQAAYRVVIISGMTTIRSTTLDLLERFCDAGGTVLVAGDPPPYVDALPNPRAADIGTRVPFDRQSLLSAIEPIAPPPVQIVDRATGEPLTDIFCQVRQDGDTRTILALNVNREQGFADAALRIRGHGSVEEWDCLTDERWRVPAEARDGCLEIVTDFPPSGEHLFVLKPQCDGSLDEKPMWEETRRTTCEGPFRYTLDEPNVCVLDRACYRLDDGPWSNPLEILQLDRALRTGLGLPQRGGSMLQPWFTRNDPREPKGSLALRLDFHVRDLPTESVELVVERPERLKIAVNGHPLAAAEANGRWVDVCFHRIPLPDGVLQVGENHVELQVDFHEGIDLEALCLLGRFGVEVDGTRRTLIDLPERLAAGSVTTQGLPFYSGRITCHVPVGELPAEGETPFVVLPAFEAACVMVRGDGAEPQMIAWQPYEADVTEHLVSGVLDLELVLTRRNTFGPLHQIPLRAGAYGPGNFTTSGAAFSDAYMLWPTGLLQPPEISWRLRVN